MHLPSVTAIYLAVLALLYAFLAIQVAPAAAEQPAKLRRQRKPRASLRDPQCTPTLSNMFRSSSLMVAMLEMSGLPATRVHVLMGALLGVAAAASLGMYGRGPHTLQFRVGRVGGITITFVLLISCAVTILLASLDWRRRLMRHIPLNYCIKYHI